MRIFARLCLGLCFFSAFHLFGAQTKVRLLLSAETAQPGETILAGVQMQMPLGWHTYWTNAGDSGKPTEIEWRLPEGITAGDVQWPVPEKNILPAGNQKFITYVYENEATLLIPLKISANISAGEKIISAKVSWQECEVVCVLGKKEVTATFTVGNETKPSANSDLIQTAQKTLPQTNLPFAVTSTIDGATTLSIQLASAKDGWDFFPYVNEGVEISGETEIVTNKSDAIVLRKKIKRTGTDWPKQILGVLAPQSAAELHSAETVQGYEVSLTPIVSSTSEDTISANTTTPSKNRSLFAILGFAFLGGLILNIMPCVLPVIALKIFGFVQQSKESPQRVKTLGLVYGLGVVLSFLVLAVLAISVQKAGGLASWGMLLQNQIFRVVLVVLVTLVALNLFGLFEITLGGGVMGAAGNLSAKDGMAGAFFNGILATVLATPCTAPFLSVAIAFAFTQPPFVTLLVFFATGLGLAAPFVILCFQPRWLNVLPKPGAWMEKFKIAMGFPMLATAMWLFWFTAPRFGKSGVLWLGLFLVTLAAAAWIWGEFVQRGRARKTLAIVIALLLLGGGYVFALERKLHWRQPTTAFVNAGSLQESADGIAWQPWSPEAVAKARAEGRIVLVDFTADNCLNCQVNKVTSLEIPSTRGKLKELGAISFLGDFTDEDPRIAAELKRYQRPGVPLVLIYPKDANSPAIVLPEILTPGIVGDALEKAAK